MNQETYQEFDALTIEGINILSTVEDTLKEELTALTQRDITLIKEHAHSKTKLLSSFSDNTLLRTKLLEQHKFQSTPESILNFFNSCQDHYIQKKCKENWNTLEAILLTVIDVNAVNEQVLKRNQKNLEGILSILQGQQANNILYNAKGSKGDYAGQSRIGKA